MNSSFLRRFSELLASSSRCTAQKSAIREAHTYSRQARGLYNNTHIQFGNSISESHRKTARNWLPNVHSHTVYSRTLKRNITIRMPASVWRTINNERYGGSIDAFLTTDSKSIQRGLGARGSSLREQILNVRLKHARKMSMPKPTGQQTSQRAEASVEPRVEEAAKLEGVASGM